MGRVLFILLLVTSLKMTSATAQEASLLGEDVSVYIFLDENLEGEQFDDFFEQVGENLDDYGISLSLTYQSCIQFAVKGCTIPSSANLLFSAHRPEKLTEPARPAMFYINTPQAISTSPILMPQNTYPAQVGLMTLLPEEYWDKWDISLVTAMALYSINRCDVAEKYFFETEKILETKASPLDSDYSPGVYLGYHILVRYMMLLRGNCAIQLGDYEKARQYFETELEPKSWYVCEERNLSIYVNLAWTYLQLGLEESAFDEELWTQIQCGGRQTKILALTKRAQLYALAFRYDDAIADIDAAIKIDPENPELYLLRGQMILLLYEWDRVLADYNRAIELDPEYADAYYYRGILFYTQGPRENAVTDFRRYLELAPDGEHAADSAQYIEDIQRELEVLNE
jgi:tetratricopeptide (TPR) repeat protein